jgi:hypothetical protein
MHRDLPCSDEMTNSGSKTLTFGPEPTEDSSSPETCLTTSTSSKARTTRAYNMYQHDAVINMMLDDEMPRLTHEYNFPSRYSRKRIKPTN